MVGVIASLSLCFALHVVFGTVGTMPRLALPLPDVSSFDPVAASLCAGAALMMLWRRIGFVPTMLALACAGLVLGTL